MPVELKVVPKGTPALGSAVCNMISGPDSPAGPMLGIESERGLYFGIELVVERFEPSVQ